MRIAPFAAAIAGCLLVVACGGATPSATSAPSSSAVPSSGEGPGATPASSAASPPSGGSTQAAATAKPTMESQREPFMQGCMKKVPAPDYCDCGWQQFQEVFKDADLSQSPPPGDPRLAALQEKTASLCSSKLPEPMIKASFVKGCESGESRLTPYCECAWPALRKTLAPADFIGELKGPRFEDAKKAMVVACKGKFPVDVAKESFMKGCTGADSGTSPKCECLWTKLRAKHSIEAIVAGTVDLQAMPELKTCK